MQLHALNQDFDWPDHKGPFKRISAEQARQYDEDGFFVIEDAFDPKTLKDLLAELDPLEAEFEQFMRDHLKGRAFIARADEITFTVHPVKRSQAARAFTQSGVFRDLVHDLIGPDVRLYWDQAVYKKPGTDAPFPWHQDNGYTYIEPQDYLTCWVALTDVTLDNGCPWVVPGVHRHGTLAHHATDLGYECFSDAPREPIPVSLSAGGVVVFSSLTTHMTGPNRTQDEIRKAYIVQFAPDGAANVSLPEQGNMRVPCDAVDRQYPVLVGGHAPEERSSTAQ